MPGNAASGGATTKARRLQRHNTDDVAAEIRAKTGIPNTATMISCTKTLCNDQQNVKARVLGRIERLAEVDEAKIEVELFLEHEKSIAKALKKIPGPIRSIVTAVRTDKVSAQVLLLKRGTFEGTDDETNKRVVNHLVDRYKGITDEHNCSRALAACSYLLPLLPDTNCKVICEVAAAHAYVEGAAKSYKSAKEARAKNLTQLDVWNTGKGRAFCMNATSNLRQLVQNCTLINTAIKEQKVGKLEEKLLKLVDGEPKPLSPQYVFFYGIKTALATAATDERVLFVQIGITNWLNMNTEEEPELPTLGEVNRALDDSECAEMMLWKSVAGHVYPNWSGEPKMKDLMNGGMSSKVKKCSKAFGGTQPHAAFKSLEGLITRVRTCGQRPYAKMPGNVTEGLPNNCRNIVLRLDQERVDNDVQNLINSLKQIGEIWDNYDENNYHQQINQVKGLRDGCCSTAVKDNDVMAPLLETVRRVTNIFLLDDLDEEAEAKAVLTHLELSNSRTLIAFPEVADAFKAFCESYRGFDLRETKKLIDSAISTSNYADSIKAYNEADENWEFLSPEPRSRLYARIKKKFPNQPGGHNNGNGAANNLQMAAVEINLDD
ncbi:unnamed protein product [Amoebophrya sp. A25]|nr:unnamed protein product [Amoebophrya sp. A25]|eukprot:GSA25T00017318001.1